MNEEMKEALDELFQYFEYENEEGAWPSLAVWSMGKYHVGPISDELYTILTSLKEQYLIADDEPGFGED